MSNSIGKRTRKREVRLQRERHYDRMRRMGDSYSKTGWWYVYQLARKMGWKRTAGWMKQKRKVLAYLFRDGKKAGVLHVGGSTLKLKLTLNADA